MYIALNDVGTQQLIADVPCTIAVSFRVINVQVQSLQGTCQSQNLILIELDISW